MRFTSKLAVRVAAVGVAAAGIGLPLASLTSAHAVTPAGASISLSKSISLTDGESITVTGANFPVSTLPVYIVECSSATSCNETPGGNGGLVIDTTGTDTGGGFTATFPVGEGNVGSGKCGRNTPTQALPSDTQCFIAASTVVSGQTTANSASANIFFNPIVTVAPTSKNLKGGQVVHITGAGYPGAAGQKVYVVECSGATLNDCGLSTLQMNAVTTAAGTFSGVAVTVVNGSLGSGLAGPAGSCTSASKNCIIAASTSIAMPPVAADEGAAPITLAKIVTAKTVTAATASGKKVPSTKKFTISGTVKAGGKGVKGLATKLEIKSGSKWKKVSALTTKAGGKFKSGKLKGPKSSAKYEVVTAKQTVGGKTYLASTSKVITVKK
jgi:hypothetical protein